MEEAKVPNLGLSLAGKILVARPDIQHDTFGSTLTLVLEHGSEGALGVVINRPMWRSPMVASFPDWDELDADPGLIFHGGPVDQDALIALGRPSGEPGELVLGAHPVDLDDQPALVRAQGISSVRVFAGYAGWHRGQLENEIAQDGWWVVDATIDDLFTDDPETLWVRVLQRQGGELAWYAHYPRDPSLN
ncbi:MAG: YqgE/AlgH family protein [Acidimicrobiia bacterium]|nr:YqgE/AlgH family protein [Acidimicrobiia bacterium]